MVNNNGGIEQFNGREGETATLLSKLSVKLGVVWWRFRPTSTPPLDASLKKDKRNGKNNKWFCAGRKRHSVVCGVWFPATPRLTIQWT